MPEGDAPLSAIEAAIAAGEETFNPHSREHLGRCRGVGADRLGGDRHGCQNLTGDTTPSKPAMM